MIRVASSCFGAYEDDWEKLSQSTLKSAVEISEDGKLVITPVAGIDKLFLKVLVERASRPFGCPGGTGVSLVL